MRLSNCNQNSAGNNDGRRVILNSLASVGQQPFRTEAERAGGNYAANHAGSHKGEVHLR